jgi:hypothetical protein
MSDKKEDNIEEEGNDDQRVVDKYNLGAADLEKVGNDNLFL